MHGYTWTGNISENFVTECLIKVQIFLNHYAEKQLDQDGYNFKKKKKYMWSACGDYSIDFIILSFGIMGFIVELWNY